MYLDNIKQIKKDNEFIGVYRKDESSTFLEFIADNEEEAIQMLKIYAHTLQYKLRFENDLIIKEATSFSKEEIYFLWPVRKFSLIEKDENLLNPKHISYTKGFVSDNNNGKGFDQEYTFQWLLDEIAGEENYVFHVDSYEYTKEQTKTEYKGRFQGHFYNKKTNLNVRIDVDKWEKHDLISRIDESEYGGRILQTIWFKEKGESL